MGVDTEAARMQTMQTGHVMQLDAASSLVTSTGTTATQSAQLLKLFSSVWEENGNVQGRKKLMLWH
jgi:hypothetical protein